MREIHSPSATLSDVPLRIRSASVAEELNQPIASPESNAGIAVIRYVPSAELEQSVSADEDGAGPPAIELTIEGPSQSIRRWLVANDPERNRLISYIGTWRFMAVENAAKRATLLEQFENELTRSPTIRIRSTAREHWQDLPLDLGRAQIVSELGCTVTVRQFLPDYAMDRTTMTPVSQSERKKNPAALVEVEHQGLKEANWVFAKFPDFAHAGGNKLPFDVVLDSPIETGGTTPDFAIVTVAGSKHEIWARKDGKSTASSMEGKAKIAIPGSQYVFSIVGYVPSANLVETYRPVGQGKGKPAIEIQFADAKGSMAQAWLGMGHFKRVVTQAGPFLVSFDGCGQTPHEGHP